MKRITTRELVNRLINRGMAVTYRERKDGGIRITSINGVKYRASTGNMEARRLTNAPLSRAQLTQRRTNNKVRFPHIKVRHVKEPINLRGLNKIIKKLGKKPLNRSSINAMIKRNGIDKVRKDLIQTMHAYAEIASEESVYWVSDFIAPYAPRTAEALRNNPASISKEMLNNIKEVVYHFATAKGSAGTRDMIKLDDDTLNILKDNNNSSLSPSDFEIIERYINE